jgi:hypothetical protein
VRTANAVSIAVKDPVGNIAMIVEDPAKLTLKCEADTCLKSDLKTLEDAIAQDARPYAERIPAHGNASDIAKALPLVYPNIVATVISDNRVEVASYYPLAPIRSEITATINTTQSPIAVPLPLFCLSGTMDLPPNRSGPNPTCGAQTPVQAANAADIVTAFSKDTVFTVTAETKVSSQLTVLCKTVCSQQDFRRITDAILRVAWPSPAYVQYLDTPPGIAGTAATSITAAKPLGVTADAWVARELG